MYHIVFSPYTLHILILIHLFAYVIDLAEQKLEEHSEQAQADDTSPNPEQAKPQCI
jgi:quinol-cytochrome oxidoreductase complex cytochrome b subunit